ncbi:hypothetical protein [Tropicibacter sp. S64]|uniref:hypothetical protein n=1 Tax=Tropicibacter sp. S64 TaxID=3415122 RepID=UPI003C7BD328
MKDLGVMGAIGVAICVCAGAVQAAPIQTQHSRVLVGESGVPGADGAPMLLCAETDMLSVFSWPLRETVTGHTLAVQSCEAQDVLPLTAADYARLDADGLLPAPPVNANATENLKPGPETKGALALVAALLALAAFAHGRGRNRATRRLRARA